MSIRVSKRLLDHSVKKVGNCVEPSNVAIEQDENGNQNDILGNGHLNLLQINPSRRGGVSTSSSEERHFTLGWIGQSFWQVVTVVTDDLCRSRSPDHASKKKKSFWTINALTSSYSAVPGIIALIS